MATKETATKSPIAFHQGRTLLMVANHYHTLLEVILECIQNALDEEASRVWVTLNQRSRLLTVSDNGSGRSQQGFEEALSSICASLKSAAKLGRHGMGLIAALGKCQQYTFTSTPKADPRGYREWTFVTRDVMNQRETVDIPMRRRTDLRFNQQGRPGEVTVLWTTQVRIERFSKDRIISRVSMETLKEAILDRFGQTMRRLGTTVSVRIKSSEGEELARDIQAEPWSGKPLDEVIIADKDAGETTFRLFLARRTEKGRKGRVQVGETGNEFRISFDMFVRAHRDLIDAEAARALASGFFEGEITVEKARLHADRKHFVENDRLAGFARAIDAWFNEHGREHFREAEEERKEERYQELGRRSMSVIEAILENPLFRDLHNAVKSFRWGTIGREHAKPPKDGGEPKVQDQPSVSTTGTPKIPSTEGGGDRSENQKENPEHTPYTVLGPKGRRRRMVRSNSIGLQFSHEEMEGSDRLWELDAVYGILRFNTRHPTWRLCEDSNRALMQLQEYLAMNAIVLHALPEEWRVSELPRLVLDQLASPYAHVLRVGDEVAGRRFGPRKAAEVKKT